MTARQHSPDHAHLISTGRSVARPNGVVLVVHGGRATSRSTVRAWQFAVLRMRPYARAIASADPDLAVYRVQLARRGWNGTGADPIRDVRWALALLRAAHPGVPIVLVGHSMGARTSFAVAGDEDVIGVVALAPWIPADDPIEQLRHRTVRVLHGANDRWVPVASTEPYLARLTRAGVDVRRLVLTATGHGMLRHWADWNRLVVADVMDLIGADGPARADTAIGFPTGRHARR